VAIPEKSVKQNTIMYAVPVSEKNLDIKYAMGNDDQPNKISKTTSEPKLAELAVYAVEPNAPIIAIVNSMIVK
jgi:hypothetical protein